MSSFDDPRVLAPRQAVRLAKARYVPETPSWRERPMQRERWIPSTPPRQVVPPKRVTESAQHMMSFFDSATPVQFDPGALRTAKPAEGVQAELKRGAKVRHEQFGVGTILTMEGSGPEAKLTVYFDGVGSKKFIAKFAKLARAEARRRASRDFPRVIQSRSLRCTTW